VSYAGSTGVSDFGEAYPCLRYVPHNPVTKLRFHDPPVCSTTYRLLIHRTWTEPCP
jgi:hypothetical protein